MPRRPLSRTEVARRTSIARKKKEATTFLRRAFTEERMADNAQLVVWTKGQMRGIRSIIKRMGLVKENGR